MNFFEWTGLGRGWEGVAADLSPKKVHNHVWDTLKGKDRLEWEGVICRIRKIKEIGKEVFYIAEN